MAKAAKKSQAGDTLTRVSFNVTAEVGFGEAIYLVGDQETIGNWDLDKAVELVTTPAAYPTWYTETPLMLKTGEKVQYKFVLSRGGKLTRWESFEGPRE